LKYDCIIIGGGLAGLTCGLKCLDDGLSCAIISAGMSALHFSSGSIDLLGYDPPGQVVPAPFETLSRFIEARPGHPYAKCGPETIEASLDFFRRELLAEGLEICSNGRDNHFHVTALGTLRPTYLSQASVFNERIREAFFRQPRIAVLTVKGFRDFHPGLAAANLRRNALFKDCEIVTGQIELPWFEQTPQNPHEFRSIDLGRMFDSGRGLGLVAARVKEAARGAVFVGLPAVIGFEDYNRVMKRLMDLTELIIYEVPTLPPSILGLRMDNALKSRFAARGGVFIAGDRVIGGEITGGRLDHVHTRNYGDSRLRAGHFVLAGGSFFSGGLVSEFDRMSEPVFGLEMDYQPGRGNWYSPAFLDRRGHPFLEYGVKTDQALRPLDRHGRPVENLLCVGAVLAGYNPVKEGSGGGTAIATGFQAALRVAAD